jgi:hypothetical protein
MTDNIVIDTDITVAMELYEKSIHQFRVMAQELANRKEFLNSKPTMLLAVKFKTAVQDLYSELDFQIYVTSKFIDMCPDSNGAKLLHERIAETIVIGKQLQEKSGIEWEALAQWQK